MTVEKKLNSSKNGACRKESDWPWSNFFFALPIEKIFQRFFEAAPPLPVTQSRKSTKNVL